MNLQQGNKGLFKRNRKGSTMDCNQLYQMITDEKKLIHAVFSGVMKKSERTYDKVDVKPALIKGIYMFHISYYYEKKVVHENVLPENFVSVLESLLGKYFKQAVFFCQDADYQVLFNKKGLGKVLKKTATKKETALEHNRRKAYIIPEDEPCDFMIHLGIMSSAGHVLSSKYDKFRQLNKYLEFVRDSLAYLPKDRTLTIIDFGCGKAYLTFALYYYLVKQCGYNVNIIGLDLKEDVIEFCNQTAEALNYKGLNFQVGDIHHFEMKETVDMVVSLHACDIATDAALTKAAIWESKVIFAVPCCQHELFKQVSHEVLNPMLMYGIQKDKFTALLTDTLRATALKAIGYEVQVVEFIDMAHTPKNVLIRAFGPNLLGEDQKREAKKAYDAMKKEFSVKPSSDAILKTTECE